MPRTGIDYSDVASACVQLMEQNQSPTIEAIRGILKTGSITTIHKHLKTWKSNQGSQAKLKHELPESVLVAVKGVHQALLHEANTKLEQLEAQHAQQIESLRQELTTLHQQYEQTLQAHTHLEQENRQLQTEKADLGSNIDTQKNLNAQQSQKNHLLSERLKDKKTDIENLHQQVKHAQTNLEHYRDATRQERQQEKLAFDTKLVQCEQQRQAAQQKMHAYQADIKSLTETRQRLTHELKQHQDAHQTLQTTGEQLKLELQKSQLDHQHLQKDHEALTQIHQTLLTQSAQDKSIIQQLQIQVEKDKEKMAGLDKSLNKAEDTVVALTDKHLFLTQEKTELAFQLQQMLETN